MFCVFSGHTYPEWELILLKLVNCSSCFVRWFVLVGKNLQLVRDEKVKTKHLQMLPPLLGLYVRLDRLFISYRSIFVNAKTLNLLVCILYRSYSPVMNLLSPNQSMIVRCIPYCEHIWCFGSVTKVIRNIYQNTLLSLITPTLTTPYTWNTPFFGKLMFNLY